MNETADASNARLHVLGLACLLFVMACAMPALVVADGETTQSWPGGFLLALGWGGLLQGQYAWLANIGTCLAGALLLRRRYIASAVISALALVLISDTLAMFRHAVAVGDDVKFFFLWRFGPGFFLWLASSLVLLVGAIGLERNRRRAA